MDCEELMPIVQGNDVLAFKMIDLPYLSRTSDMTNVAPEQTNLDPPLAIGSSSIHDITIYKQKIPLVIDPSIVRFPDSENHDRNR